MGRAAVRVQAQASGDPSLRAGPRGGRGRRGGEGLEYGQRGKGAKVTEVRQEEGTRRYFWGWSSASGSPKTAVYEGVSLHFHV